VMELATVCVNIAADDRIKAISNLAG